MAGVIVLVALGLRWYRLDGQSLWYDEGVSAFMTHRTFAEIAVATSVDIHPPLYYWLLAIWAVPFGNGEIALRSLSVVLGTLTVWATWRLGRMLAGTAVGLAAAALLAISPLAVQYSQEVRMYALAGLLAVASTWAGLALLSALASPDPAEGRPGRLLPLALTYALLTAALLYTHYYGTLVVAAQQLYAGLILFTTRRWRIVLWWGFGSGLAALLFLAWLPVALRQTGYYPGLGSPQPAWSLVLDAVNVLSLGIATTRFAFRAGLLPFLVLAGLGVVAMGPSRHFTLSPPPPQPPSHAKLGAPPYGPPRVASGRGGWGGEGRPYTAGSLLLLLWLILPIGGIVAMSQTRPLYEPRFLVGSSRVDLQACKLEYSIVSPK